MTTHARPPLNHTGRRFFSSSPVVAEIPPLLQLQENSYKKFLQEEDAPEKRLMQGLQNAFNAIFRLCPAPAWFHWISNHMNCASQCMICANAKSAA